MGHTYEIEVNTGTAEPTYSTGGVYSKDEFANIIADLVERFPKDFIEIVIAPES